MLIETEIRWDKSRQLWTWRDPISGEATDSSGKTKREFVSTVSAVLKSYVQEQGLAFTLRICNEQNQYAEERTYPRAADPVGSPG